jgi:hypothetical protein
MDPLAEHARRSARRRDLAGATLAAGALLGIALASCLGVRNGTPTFPHSVHVDGMKLQCTFCHATVRTADMPTMPPPEICAPCHDELDRGVPPERRIAAFYEPGGRYRRAAPKALAADVVYSHRDHVGTAKLDCAECHAQVIAADHIVLDDVNRKPDCMQCHADRGFDNNDCSRCHRQIDRSWRPHSHAQSWADNHGEIVRRSEQANEHRCSLCHDQATSCQACHQTRLPRSHDDFFRLRGHGMLAALDRSRCYTCHRTDSCEQCHTETRPLSHRGGFGAPQHRHCTNCHFPLADTGCRVCHRATPGHQQAAPMPPSHTPAMNCRLCHGNGQPLPHVDGGQPCTICHQ